MFSAAVGNVWNQLPKEIHKEDNFNSPRNMEKTVMQIDMVILGLKEESLSYCLLVTFKH